MSCETTSHSKAKFLSSYNGFESAPGLDNAQIYRGEVDDLGSYDRVYIEPVRVIASEAGTGKATSEEIRTLKAKFQSQLKAELSKSHQVVSRPGRKTLAVRTALVELHPGNPALFLASYAPYGGVVSTAVGVATGTNLGASAAAVQAEVVDSRTGEQYFAVIDRNQAAKWAPAQGLTRWGAAEASFRKWSSQIRKAISVSAKNPKTVKTVKPSKKAPGSVAEVQGAQSGAKQARWARS
ncbi:MAG: Protein of unknown function DUF3313 [Verrucomicrobia bacterium]|jgi:hypothetical protein|nr:MAG: Protein of unknown function DUF3313 [Verrucomicrobiota bacterium]